MPGSLTLVELNGRMTDAATALVNFCSSLTEEQFFHQPENKWSVAQQLKHLIISTRTARLAYSLPKFIVRLVAGKPNRLSRSYDELVATYNFKLQQGGKASARYVPAKIPASTFGKKRLLTDFSGVTQKLTREAEKNWDEKN